MATFSKLPCGRYRVQIRKDGFYRAATFDRKGDAEQGLLSREWVELLQRVAKHEQEGTLEERLATAEWFPLRSIKRTLDARADTMDDRDDPPSAAIL